jgi:hypothetical protein
MEKPKSPPEMGLTRETWHKAEIAMPYWLQFSSPEFIRLTIRHLRHEMSVSYTLLNLMKDDSIVKNLPVEKLGGKTVDEVCEMILGRKSKIEDILDVAWTYAETIEPQEPRPQQNIDNE